MLGSELNKTSKQPPPTVLSQFERLAESARTLQERIGDDQTPDGESLKTILATFQALEDKIKNGGMFGKLAALNILTELVRLLENEMDKETLNQHSLFNEMLRFLVTLDLRSVPENASFTYPAQIVDAAKKLRIIIAKAEAKLINDAQEHRETLSEPPLAERDTVVAVDRLFSDQDITRDKLKDEYLRVQKEKDKLRAKNSELNKEVEKIRREVPKTLEEEFKVLGYDIDELKQQKTLLDILKYVGHVDDSQSEFLTISDVLKLSFSTFSQAFHHAMSSYVEPMFSFDWDYYVGSFLSNTTYTTPAYKYFYEEFQKEKDRQPQERLEEIRQEQIKNNTQISRCEKTWCDLKKQTVETTKMAIFKAMATTFLTAELDRVENAFGATWLNFQNKNQKKDQLKNLLKELKSDEETIVLDDFVNRISEVVAVHRNASDTPKGKTRGSEKFEKWKEKLDFVYAIEEIQGFDDSPASFSRLTNKESSLTRLTDAAESVFVEKIASIVNIFYSDQLKNSKSVQDGKLSQLIKVVEDHMKSNPENLIQQKELYGKILAYTTCIVNFKGAQLDLDNDSKQIEMMTSMQQNYVELCQDPAISKEIKSIMLTVFPNYEKIKGLRSRSIEDPTSVADIENIYCPRAII